MILIQMTDRIKHLKKQIIAAGVAITVTLSLCGCHSRPAYDPLEGVGTTQVKDDAGRTVTVPEQIDRVAVSGPASQMILTTLAPEKMAGLSASFSTKQMDYFPEDLWYLPTFGQFYGGKASLNMEALIAAEPQVIIDLGDKKVNIASDMNSIQNQTGIPTVFFEATLPEMADAYRQLGTLLHKEEKAEELAGFIEETLAMAERHRTEIPDGGKKTVLYGTGATGLAVNAEGSSQSQVIDIVGGKNAVVPDVLTDKGGGTTVNMEAVYTAEPDVIIVTSDELWQAMADNEWSQLKAVREGRYYAIPSLPYCWMSGPPSVNMILGVWWLGQLLYPDIYNDYDMTETAQEYYRLFWNYDLSEEEAKEMLAHSTILLE